MNKLKLSVFTTLTMLAFASNSLLCRMAMKETTISSASYTSIRLLSGAATLWFIMYCQKQASTKYGSWRSALALFVYAVTLSFAYRSINTGAGALVLFGAVQLTMLLAGYLAGERMSSFQNLGFAAALAGLVILVSPNAVAPSIMDSLLMLASGIAWGLYSIFGRGLPDPVAATAGNFIRAVPMAIGLSIVTLPWMHIDSRGLIYATVSGAITSGIGYLLWYRILQHMSAMTASTIQLSSPLLASIGGVVLLGEVLTRELMVASILILGGIWLVLRYRKK